MPKENTIEIIFDSHGNGLVADKNCKHQKVNITVLGQGKKNIAGASEYINQLEHSPNHLVIGVGCKDLANKPTSMVIDDMNRMLQHITPTIRVLLFQAF